MPFNPPPYERFPHLHDFNPGDDIQAAKALDYVHELLDADQRADEEALLEQVYDCTDLLQLRDDALDAGYEEFADRMDAEFETYFEDDIERLEAAAPAHEAHAPDTGEDLGAMDEEEARKARERLERMGVPATVVDLAQAHRSVMDSTEPDALREALEAYGDASASLQREANLRGLAEEREDPDTVRYRAARQVLHSRIQPVGQDEPYLV